MQFNNSIGVSWVFFYLTVSTVLANPVQLLKATPSLPNPSTFLKDNGTQWTIEYVGNIKFTGSMGTKGLGGDKCRSSYLGGKYLWNCGDMQCKSDYTVCGFNMGPGFYGTGDVMTINASAYDNIADYQFAGPWKKDPKPVSPQWAYGMDTSNVAPINATTGVAYVWEITRGASDGSYVDQGAGIVAVTLGKHKPIATRVGPLLTGSDAIQVGLLAIMRDGNYIYSYSSAGALGNLIVGRVAANQDAFDAKKYQFLKSPASASSAPVWVSGIPTKKNASQYGMRSGDSNGMFGCDVYGSVFWNNYLKKYMIICTIYMDTTNFYTADKPWGPWSAQYKFLKDGGWKGYGVSAHPAYSPGGSHKTLYFSQGPNGVFNTFKVTFGY